MLFFLFPKSASRSLSMMEVSLTSVPHLGQRAGAFTKPPDIAMNS